MTRSLGRLFRALGSQQIVAVASLLALAACANGTPVNPTGKLQSLAGEAPEDVAEADGQEAAGSLEATADDQGQAVGELGEAVASDGSPPPDPVSSEPGTFSQYIAFGDSFTSGFGLDLASIGPISSGDSCARSDGAWPPLVNEILGITGPFTFAACSGATTLDVIAAGSNSQIAVLPAPEELDRALITIQIGGNDIKLHEDIQKCFDGLKALKMSTSLTQTITALSQLSPQCADLDWLLDNFGSFVSKSLEENLNNTFTTLRAAAPKAAIAAVGYPHLVNATTDCTGLLALVIPIEIRVRMNALADAINGTIENAARSARIDWITTEVVDAFTGYEACSPQEMISSINMHPNAAGHATYALVVANGVLVAQMRKGAPDEGDVIPIDVQTVAEQPPVDGAGEQPQGEGVGEQPPGT
jgi:lysophospholipase L1-like esterase